MAATYPRVNLNGDKGLILQLTGTGITTAYQYTSVVNVPTQVPALPSGAAGIQASGSSRNVTIYVSLNSGAGSSITTIDISVEVAYGNYTDFTGTAQTVDLTAAPPWAQVLSQVHAASAALALNSACVFGAAAANKTILVTCALPVVAKNLRIGAKADAAGQAGDILNLFAGAW